MKKKLASWALHINPVYIYLLIMVGIGVSECFIPTILAQQDKLSYSYTSNFTLNFLLLYFLAGYLGDKVGKRNKKLGYVVMIGGIVAISSVLFVTK